MSGAPPLYYEIGWTRRTYQKTTKPLQNQFLIVLSYLLRHSSHSIEDTQQQYPSYIHTFHKSYEQSRSEIRPLLIEKGKTKMG